MLTWSISNESILRERGVSYNPNSFWSDYHDWEEYPGDEDKDYLNDPEDALEGAEIVFAPGVVGAEGGLLHTPVVAGLGD